MESGGAAGDGGMARSGEERHGGRGLRHGAYLFSGMRQVRYPQLRLAHLFMLNAVPWEARPCHRKYRNPFFSLSAAPTLRRIRSTHPPDLGSRISDEVHRLLTLLFHLPLVIH